MYILKIHKVGHCAMIWLGAAKNPLDDPLLLWTERPLKSSEPLEANKLTRRQSEKWAEYIVHHPIILLISIITTKQQLLSALPFIRTYIFFVFYG